MFTAVKKQIEFGKRAKNRVNLVYVTIMKTICGHIMKFCVAIEKGAKNAK